MLKTVANPKNLREAINYFADPDRALAYVVQLRWPNGIHCPACDATRVSFLKSRRIWKCLDCRRQFSVKLGTIFEDSPLGLDKWLPALWLLANAKNGISSYELGRSLGVTQKSAWFMLHRIRLAMASPTFERFDGDVEVDETFIGGRAKNMHRGKGSKYDRVIKGHRGKHGKQTVLGVLQRGPKGTSRIAVTHAKRTTRKVLVGNVRKHVEEGANIYSDQYRGYQTLGQWYDHETVDHAIEYVRGKAHTNNLEKLLEPVEADPEGHLRQRGPVPPSRLSGRTGVALQQPRRQGWRAVRGQGPPHHRQEGGLEHPDWTDQSRHDVRRPIGPC